MPARGPSWQWPVVLAATLISACAAMTVSSPPGSPANAQGQEAPYSQPTPVAPSGPPIPPPALPADAATTGSYAPAVDR